MACCAIGPCGRQHELVAGPGMVYDAGSRTWSCYLCYVMPRLFTQPSLAKQTEAEAAMLEERERATRDGEPTLAAARKRPGKSIKRNRAGPLYVPHNRRV